MSFAIARRLYCRLRACRSFTGGFGGFCFRLLAVASATSAASAATAFFAVAAVTSGGGCGYDIGRALCIPGVVPFSSALLTWWLRLLTVAVIAVTFPALAIRIPAATSTSTIAVAITPA